MLSIVTMPDASAILSGTTAYSGAMFTDFLPLIYLAVGILVAVLAVLWVKKSVSGGVSKLFGGRKGGRKKRGY